MASLALKGQTETLGKASLAMTGQVESSRTASLAMTGQVESSGVNATAQRGAEVDAIPSGGSAAEALTLDLGGLWSGLLDWSCQWSELIDQN